MHGSDCCFLTSIQVSQQTGKMVSYSHLFKMMLSNCCTQYGPKSGKPRSGHKTGKGQYSPQFSRRAVRINVHIPRQSHSSLMLGRLCLKILHARLQHYMNQELTDVQAGFRNSGGTRHQIANICWIIEKAREFKKKKTSIYVSLTTLKPLTVWITKICGKLLKKWEYQTTWPASWEICIQIKKQQLELDIEL